MIVRILSIFIIIQNYIKNLLVMIKKQQLKSKEELGFINVIVKIMVMGMIQGYVRNILETV